MENDPLNLQTLLPDLDPPPGGLARLRQRLAGQGRKRSRLGYLRPALAGMTVLLLGAMLYVYLRPTGHVELRAMLQPGANTWALGLVRPLGSPQTGRGNPTAFTKVVESPSLVWYQSISLNLPSPVLSAQGGASEPQ